MRQCVHGGVILSERIGRPVHRPAGQSAPRSGELVRLGEGAHRTQPLTAAPDPLAPGDPDRAAPERGVVQHLDPAAVCCGDHPALRAARDRLVGLDEQPELDVVPFRGQDTHPVHAEHHRCRRAALTTVHSAEAFTIRLLGRTRSLRASAPSPLKQHAPACRPHHARFRRATYPRGSQPRCRTQLDVTSSGSTYRVVYPGQASSGPRGRRRGRRGVPTREGLPSGAAGASCVLVRLCGSDAAGQAAG